MFLYITNADTELLTFRVAADALHEAGVEFRAISAASARWRQEAESAEIICVRLLGGKDAFLEGLEELSEIAARNGSHLLCFSGESTPDPELTLYSTVPAGIVAQGFEYLIRGGTENYLNFVKFISDTCLFSGLGFLPPVTLDETLKVRSSVSALVIYKNN